MTRESGDGRRIWDAIVSLGMIVAVFVGVWTVFKKPSQSVTGPSIPPLPSGLIPINHESRIGKPEARVVVIEFSDFQCPYCIRFANAVFPELKRRLLDTGRIQLVFRQFPIATSHPDALRAAHASVCAGLQGRFWPMHDALFESVDNLSVSGIRNQARRVEVDDRAFQECLNEKAASLVQTDIDLAKTLRLTGTPTFLIGAVADGGSAVAVRRIILGVVSPEAFVGVVEQIEQQAASDLKSSASRQ